MHLSNTYAQNLTQDYSFNSSRRISLMQKQIEDISTALSLMGIQTEKTIPISQEYETTLHAQRSTIIVSQLRGAKSIIVKIINSLEDHDSRSLSLTDNSQLIIKRCENAIEHLFNILQKLGPLQLSEDGKTTSSGHNESNDIFKVSESSPDFSNSTILDSLMSEVQSLKVNLTQLAQFCQGSANTLEISRPPAPWALRARNINELKSVPIKAETDLKNLRSAISNAASELLNRETALEDAKVKIELLETRAKDSSVKSARIDELQQVLEQYHTRADELTKAVQNYKIDLNTLAAERDQLRRDVELRKYDGRLHDNSKGRSHYEMLLVAKMQEIFPLRAENSVLRAALMFLREQSGNHRMSTFLSPRCSIMSHNNHLRESPPSNTDHIRTKISGSELPVSWLAAPLVSRQDYASYNISASRASKLFIFDPAILPKPIILSKLSGRSSRLKWQPLRCMAQWQLSIEEKKMTLWSQRWLSVKPLS